MAQNQHGELFYLKNALFLFQGLTDIYELVGIILNMLQIINILPHEKFSRFNNLLGSFRCYVVIIFMLFACIVIILIVQQKQLLSIIFLVEVQHCKLKIN